LQLVPNPATNQVQLIWKGEVADFEIVDAIGRTLVEKGSLKESLNIPTTHWPIGLYRIKVVSKDGIEIKALQILR